MDETAIKQELEAARAAYQQLSGRHVTLNYASLLVVLVLVVGFGWLALKGMQKYGEAVGRTEALVQTYEAREDKRIEELKEAYKAYADLSGKQKTVERTIIERDKKTVEEIKKVTEPDRSIEQVLQDSKTYLRTSPIYLTDQKLFGFEKPDVQRFVQTQIERDAFKADLDDTKRLYGLEQQKSALLNQSLTTANDQLTYARGTITDLGNQVKKTKRQKVWDSVKTGGALLAGFGLGKALK